MARTCAPSVRVSFCSLPLEIWPTRMSFPSALVSSRNGIWVPMGRPSWMETRMAKEFSRIKAWIFSVSFSSKRRGTYISESYDFCLFWKDEKIPAPDLDPDRLAAFRRQRPGADQGQRTAEQGQRPGSCR